MKSKILVTGGDGRFAKVLSKKNKKLNIKKSGIGEKIYFFAHQQSAAYGILTVLFAILSGLIAATIFRRL